MKRLAITAMVTGLMLATWTILGAAEKGGAWTQDLQQARALAQKTGKPILANFTGSDWCGYCIKQENEVFSSKEFQQWAEKNVVLLTVDFPNQKALPAKVKQQNDELKKKFGVRGFPTLVFMDAKGNEIGGDGQGRMVGYSPGSGFSKWQQRAEGIIKKSGASGE